jgi:NAD dependent epimerase/dehydratase family enzyme
MKVFITGGMGFIGSNLTSALSANGYEVTVLDRSIHKDRPVPESVLRVEGDSTKPGPWQDQLAAHDTVMNLASASIFQRWNSEVKRALRARRVLTARNVVHALAARKGKDRHLFSTDAVGYYGFRGDEILDENSPPGTDSLAQLGADWGAEALRVEGMGLAW